MTYYKIPIAELLRSICLNGVRSILAKTISTDPVLKPPFSAPCLLAPLVPWTPLWPPSAPSFGHSNSFSSYHVPDACCLLPVACCLSPVVYCLSPIAWYSLLPIVCCVLCLYTYPDNWFVPKVAPQIVKSFFYDRLKSDGPCVGLCGTDPATIEPM